LSNGLIGLLWFPSLDPSLKKFYFVLLLRAAVKSRLRDLPPRVWILGDSIVPESNDFPSSLNNFLFIMYIFYVFSSFYPCYISFWKFNFCETYACFFAPILEFSNCYSPAVPFILMCISEILKGFKAFLGELYLLLIKAGLTLLLVGL